MDREPLVKILLAERVKILAYIQLMVRREDLAEDVFQDVFAIALEKHHTIQDELHLLKWLRTTSRFQAFATLRKARSNHVSLNESSLELLEPVWQKLDHDRGARRAEALANCVESLPKRAKDLLQRRYMHELDYTELARLLKRPVPSLYVALSRIHKLLADCISNRLMTSDGA
jgi:RNA polymerase sigma factor (sigma-70 family)